MVERVSALNGALEPRQLGTVPSDGPGITLAERQVASLWLVGAWPGRVAAVGSAAAAAAGAEAPPEPGRAVVGSAGTLMRTEPLKWLLLGEAEIARPDIAGEDGTVLDLSHARTLIRIGGPARADLLARMVAVDMRPARFGPGQFAATGVHGMGVTLIAREGAVDLLVLRSFARTLWDQMLEIAPQFGVEITGEG